MKLHTRIFYSLFFIFIAGLSSFAQTFPTKSDRLVNDYVGILDNSQVSTLEQKLIAYNDSTSTQVAIVIVNSVDGYEIADYAQRLAENWGVGQKAKDNGIIILAAIQDRKITIQTGYGMEGVITDAIARRIIEKEIKPAFKAGNYYEGFDLASTAIFKFASGEYTADAYSKKKEEDFPFGIIIILFIVIVVFLSRRKQKYQNIGGRGTGYFPPFIGGSGSGSFGNFSGGSGGFGGFGGGSFGGGGASGSW